MRGLPVRNFTAKVQGLTFPAGRMSHVQTAGAEAILDHVPGPDPALRGFQRPAGRRMAGSCCHFALLHSRLAAAAESAETTRECLDLYPDSQPPADAAAR